MHLSDYIKPFFFVSNSGIFFAQLLVKNFCCLFFTNSTFLWKIGLKNTNGYKLMLRIDIFSQQVNNIAKSTLSPQAVEY